MSSNIKDYKPFLTNKNNLNDYLKSLKETYPNAEDKINQLIQSLNTKSAYDLLNNISNDHDKKLCEKNYDNGIEDYDFDDCLKKYIKVYLTTYNSYDMRKREGGKRKCKKTKQKSKKGRKFRKTKRYFKK